MDKICKINSFHEKLWRNKKNAAKLGSFNGVNSGDPAGIRTPDTLLKRQVLCRLSYWIKKIWGG